MDRLRKFISGEVAGWKTWELLWLLVCICTITVVSLMTDDNVLSVSSAVFGIIYTNLAGKGKRSCYIFGVVQILCYSILSLNARLYGEVMLNMLYYLPMMFVGFFFWKGKLDSNGTIIKTRLDWKGRCILTIASLLGIAVYALLLKAIGDAQPWVDSVTTVLSVSAMVMTVRRCIEQWSLWGIVNSISAVMWYRYYLAEGGAAATIVMWAICLANSLIFYLQWKKEGEESCGKTLQ